MKKNIISVLIMSCLIFVTVQILLSSEKIFEIVSFSFDIWKKNIFPSLFPFFVLSDILINYGFVEFIGELFKPLMQKIFKTNGNAAYVFIMGMISGFPSSAKYTSQLYDQKLIDEKCGTKILMFTHFSNPLFILGTISIAFLNAKNVGLLILLCHYFSNIIIGFLFRNYYPSKNENTKFSFKNPINKMTQYRVKNKKSIGQIINDSIIASVNTLLLILGTITVFLIITTIISNIINLNPYCQAILNGLIEMTQGLKYTSNLDLSLKFKTIVSTMLISFGGLSVHMQTMSFINKTKIKYFPFFIARIIHAIISGLLVFLFFDLWIKIF
ncbi:MAG: hypothetical protein E7165_00600 [Firmicutes bacterium]|nr:hypothetical protein [Bacillota bacterium]